MAQEREKKKWMFPLKHVTSAQLTAENNLGLRAGGWLTQTSSVSLWGVRPWADGKGGGGEYRQRNNGFGQNCELRDDGFFFFVALSFLTRKTQLAFLTIKIHLFFHLFERKEKTLNCSITPGPQGQLCC